MGHAQTKSRDLRPRGHLVWLVNTTLIPIYVTLNGEGNNDFVFVAPCDAEPWQRLKDEDLCFTIEDKDYKHIATYKFTIEQSMEYWFRGPGQDIKAFAIEPKESAGTSSHKRDVSDDTDGAAGAEFRAGLAGGNPQAVEGF